MLNMTSIVTPLRRPAVLAMVAFAIGACDTPFDVPDLNNPGLEQLESDPTPAAVVVAAQGLLIGARTGHTGQISTTSHMGILGRESLVFDNSDPRYIDEILAGNFNAGNGAFGGFGWAPRYANLRNASIVLNALESVVGFTDEETAGIRGFTRTIMALDFYWTIMLRNQNGAVIDVNRTFGDELAAIESPEAVLDHIESLLDQADSDLAAAGSSFAISLPSGFEGFDTPATFRDFNRAVKARVQVIRGEYGEALASLGGTWVDQAAPLDMGVYHSFSTIDGDATNGLFQGADPQIVAHPSLADAVQTAGDGSDDDRYAAKVFELDAAKVDARGVSSSLAFAHYPSLESPLPIIRNEELLLLRAEARWFTGDPGGAMSDLNHVRTTSGGLTEIGTPGSDEAFIDALLYERLFSLLFEGGHRWIDMRRFDRLGQLPRDRASDEIPASFPIPRNECIARGLEGCSWQNQ
jgi:hypothetical protein